ncbi:MAG: GGDEF domain-containing protein [Magnetococcales bacterium]|nr:GGDEF domain-containing protein [Magnetococcales bacterium]
MGSRLTITLTLVSGLFLILLLGSTWFYLKLEKTMERQVFDRFKTEAHSRINDFDALLKATTREFKTFIEIPAFKLLSYSRLTMNRASERSVIRHLELYFRQMEQDRDSIKRISFINTHGHEIIKVEDHTIVRNLGDVSQRSDIKRALLLPQNAIQANIGINGNYLLSLPIYASPTIHLGVLLIELDFSSFKRAIDNMIIEGITEVILLDKNNKRLYGNHNHDLGDVNWWHKAKTFDSSEANMTLIYSGNNKLLLKNITSLRSIFFFVVMPMLVIIFSLLIWKIFSHTREELKLHKLASTDPMTGLANRRHFNSRFEQSATYARRYEQEIGLLMIDLDKFKPINDIHGHHVGDMVLKKVANILQKQSRDSSMVARMGGDEFAIIITGPDSRSGLEPMAKRILETLSVPMNIKGKSITIGASIGIAVFPTDGEQLDQLLILADTALYAVKEAGKNDFKFYKP